MSDAVADLLPRAPVSPTKRPVAIANCSGFYGDRLGAATELLEGELPIDVLTGDYLAELTMYILHKSRRRDDRAGYAVTFLAQMELVLGTCLERGIRVVANAGGLNPFGLAERLSELADRLGLSPSVAVVHGDDVIDRLDELQRSGHPLANLDTGVPWSAHGRAAVTANAYLGAGGITEALRNDADVVICPRVTDASLVVGPAAWWHGWGPGDVDQLAGAVAAGHLIECGAQVTGGNYSVRGRAARRPVPGLPHRRGGGRRLRDGHEAAGHRRSRLGRHGHSPAPLRDRAARLPVA